MTRVLTKIEHANSKGWTTLEHTTNKYRVYECNHCDEQFKHREDSIGSRGTMIDSINTHMEEKHPEELGRDRYPNEDVFRQWADEIGVSVIEPVESGDALVAKLGGGKEVKLFEHGEIVLTQFRHLGNAQADDATVSIEGNRLVVSRNDDKQYVSPSAYPIDQ